MHTSEPLSIRGRLRIADTIGIALLLLDLAVVLVVLIFPGGNHRTHLRDPIDTARQQMNALGNAVDLYFLENRRLPPSLDALTLPSGKSELPYLDSIPTDPWKVAYRYRFADPNLREYSISSAGEDGEFGTEDDIVHPKSGDYR